MPSETSPHSLPSSIAGAARSGISWAPSHSLKYRGAFIIEKTGKAIGAKCIPCLSPPPPTPFSPPCCVGNFLQEVFYLLSREILALWESLFVLRKEPLERLFQGKHVPRALHSSVTLRNTRAVKSSLEMC